MNGDIPIEAVIGELQAQIGALHWELAVARAQAKSVQESLQADIPSPPEEENGGSPQ